jgi:hypothetical protein
MKPYLTCYILFVCVWRIYDEENMKIVIQALMVILCLLSLTFVRFTALSTVFKTTLCIDIHHWLTALRRCTGMKGNHL